LTISRTITGRELKAQKELIYRTITPLLKKRALTRTTPTQPVTKEIVDVSRRQNVPGVTDFSPLAITADRTISKTYNTNNTTKINRI